MLLSSAFVVLLLSSAFVVLLLSSVFVVLLLSSAFVVLFFTILNHRSDGSMQGVITAPLLFALEENKSLAPLMQRKFAQEGDVQEVHQPLARNADCRCLLNSGLCTNRSE